MSDLYSPTGEKPRPAATYRAARRNRCRAEKRVWAGIKPRFRVKLQHRPGSGSAEARRVGA